MSRRSLNAFGAIRRQNLRAQNYLVMWVDSNIDMGKEDFKKSLAELRSVVSEVKLCLDAAQCIRALNKLDDGKAFVISSGALGERLVPEIHAVQSLDTIFIFCTNKERHEQWAKDWTKIEGIYTSIKPICESLKKVVHACNHNDMPMSFLPKQLMASSNCSSKENLDQLPVSFMYSVIFKEIILEIDDEPEKQMNALVAYCHAKNISESEVIDFQQRYCKRSPVWWYTREIFLYGMLNQALRTFDMVGMTKMGFFIRHLHLQLEKLYQEQSNDYKREFIVFRGQGLSQEDFKNLSDSKGGLLSFKNFLSTSKKKEISMLFVRETMRKYKDFIGVLFIMTIDSQKISPSSTPFAFIDEESAMEVKEQEILFTMHTVFRVRDIKQTSENNRLYEVQLTMTSDNDPQLAALTERFKEEIDGKGWYRMGVLMLKVGDFDQAEELYNQLLEDSTCHEDQACIYHQLGWLKSDQGKNQEAIRFYEKSLQIKLKTLPENDISLASTYSNIGGVYKNMCVYSTALEFYEKSHQIYEKSLPRDHSDLAISYNNIGQVHSAMRNYPKALESYTKSLKIKEKILPPNHPSLAISKHDIGVLYENMKEYSRAQRLYQETVEIAQLSLPSNHPHLQLYRQRLENVKKKI